LIGDIAATLLTREDPGDALSFTQHPVEDGEDFSDYAIELENPLTLDLRFYSDPIVAGLNVKNAQQNLGRPLSTWEQKRDAIRGYKNNRTVIDVFTGYDLYESRVISEIILNRTPETSQCWAVTIVFQKARRVRGAWSSVSLEELPESQRTDRLKTGAKKKPAPKKGGDKPTKPVDEKKAEEIKSWFAQGRAILG
jgi:hypothetical protein